MRTHLDYLSEVVIEEKGSGVNLYTVLRTRKLSRINDKNTVGMFRGLSGYCGLIQANIHSNNICNNPSHQDGGSIGPMLVIFLARHQKVRGAFIELDLPLRYTLCHIIFIRQRISGKGGKIQLAYVSRWKALGCLFGFRAKKYGRT